MIKQGGPSFSAQQFGQMLSQHWKKVTVYGFLLLVIAVNLCMFLHSTLVQLSCFALLGSVNTWLFYRQRLLAAISMPVAKLAFISLLFVVMVLVLFTYYFFSGSPSLIMAFASSGAFLLPFVLCYSWDAFVAIPAKQYPAWYLPATETSTAVSTTHPVQLQLRIARKAGKVDTFTYPLTASAKLKLGKAFELFITAMERPANKTSIELKDISGQYYGWQFYHEKWYGIYRRLLDPAASLLANQLKPNARIIAVRMAEDY